MAARDGGVDPDARTRISESKPDPLIGRTVDGYRIEDILGRGGMGTVYRATQLSLGRAVALKVLTDELVNDKQFLERFHRESDALSRLAHPNIVTVFERGDIEGRPYLVMEFVEGPSLRQIMREGALPPAEAFRIVSSVLSALQHAHDKGIVHRDIKPENVLLARGDVVKVADFGLSLLVDMDVTRLTRTHLVLGTYEYMAPEQRERSKQADHRSDLYATGVVLYEMLTGGLPIGRFALPSSDRPKECDVRMDRIIERSLEKDPELRYQEAGEMASAVSDVLEHAGDFEPPPHPPRAAPAAGGRKDSSAIYRPARFEHHVDNLATIDQVLGTVCYVLAIAGLFGMLRALRPLGLGPLGGMESILLFLMGWYLRETGEKLRKYRLTARTSQAVIAMLAGFTVILLPYTIYSFWVLFGHRGRTYYEARNRGLGENEAARHTFRVIESDFTPPPMPPPPPTARGAARSHDPAPRAPHPDQIPLQSMLTSNLESAVDDTPAPQRRKRVSRWVKLGVLAAIATIITGAAMAADNPIYAGSNDAIAAMFIATISLLGVGFLASAVRRNRRGWVTALVALIVVSISAAVFLNYIDDYSRRYHAGRNQRISMGRLNQSSHYLAQYLSLGSMDPRFAELTPAQIEWIRGMAGIEGDLPIRLQKLGNFIRAEVPRNFAPGDAQKRLMLISATREAIVRAHPTELKRYGTSNRGKDEYMRATFAGVEAPGDQDRSRVWIGTFKRGADGPGQPDEESWEPTVAEIEWLHRVTGCRAADQLELDARKGLIHVSLPNWVFSQDSRGAWLLVLAAQQLVKGSHAQRAPAVRHFQPGTMGLQYNVANELLAEIKRRPPPVTAANR